MVNNNNEVFKSINWNAIEDMVDKMTYEKLTSQFWLSTRMPVSKDKGDWSKLSEVEKELVEKVFGGLTALDTLQSESGVDSLKADARTQHELAVLNNIAFMESEHARSYSSIFSTLNTPKEINDIFKWCEENKYLQKKAKIIENIYKNGTALEGNYENSGSLIFEVEDGDVIEITRDNVKYTFTIKKSTPKEQNFCKFWSSIR